MLTMSRIAGLSAPLPINPPPTAQSLAERWNHLVRGLCARGVSLADAEDAAQDAMLAGLQALASGKTGLINLPAWLWGVANHAASAVAKRQLMRCDLDTISPPAIDPWLEVEHLEQVAALREAIEALPEQLKGPVQYCVLEGNTQVQAEKMFGVCAGAISRRLLTARSLIRSHLQSLGYDFTDFE